jgi:hypothetical protein
MIEDISNRLLGEFARCLQTSLAGPGAVAEAPEPAVAGAPTSAAGSAAGAAAEAAEVETGGEAVAEAAVAGAAGAASPGAGNGTPAGFTPPVQPVESEPVEGLSLMGSVLWNQAKRNPAPIVALVLGFLLALRVFRHRD